MFAFLSVVFLTRLRVKLDEKNDVNIKLNDAYREIEHLSVKLKDLESIELNKSTSFTTQVKIANEQHIMESKKIIIQRVGRKTKTKDLNRACKTAGCRGEGNTNKGRLKHYRLERFYFTL